MSVTSARARAGTDVRDQVSRAIGAVLVLMLHLLLLAGAIITVWPFLWMVLSSFKTTTEVFRYPPVLLPVHSTTLQC